MNRQHVDSVIADWLEDAPSALPAVARHGMLRRILATPQAGTWPRWLRIRRHAALAAAGIATATAVALVLPRIAVAPGTVAPLGPASSIPERPSADQGRQEVAASRFLRGFTYDMPRDEIAVRVISGGLAGYDAGDYAVNVWLPGEVPVDPCNAGGLRREVSGTDFVAYLRRVPGLEVGPTTERYVDDILATEVRLRPAEDRPCIAVDYLIDPLSGTTASMTRGGEARLTVLEVDGRLMVLVAESRTGLDAWLQEVDTFLASIDFLPPY